MGYGHLVWLYVKRLKNIYFFYSIPFKILMWLNILSYFFVMINCYKIHDNNPTAININP